MLFLFQRKTFVLWMLSIWGFHCNLWRLHARTGNVAITGPSDEPNGTKMLSSDSKQPCLFHKTQLRARVVVTNTDFRTAVCTTLKITTLVRVSLRQRTTLKWRGIAHFYSFRFIFGLINTPSPRFFGKDVAKQRGVSTLTRKRSE